MLLARYVDLAYQASDTSRLRVSIPKMCRNLHELDHAHIKRLLVIATKTDDAELAHAIAQEVLRRNVIDYRTAVDIFTLVSAEVDHEKRREIQVVLEGKLKDVDQARLRVSGAFFEFGSEAAYREARRLFPKVRTPREAAFLADAVAKSGRPQLASRFLRFCTRRWPRSAQVRNAMIMAFLAGGHINAAQSYLDRQGDRCTPRDLVPMQLRVLIHAGKLKSAGKLIEETRRPGRGKANPTESLMVFLGLGDIELAKKTVSDHFPHERAHFRATHLGSLLNELEIYQSAGSLSGSQSRDEVESYFAAASRVVDDWATENDELGTDSFDGTRRILQYWDAPEPGFAVSELMATWKNIPGWSYLRLDRAEAMEWLLATFGAKYVQAFRLARNVAEESDFLRLCLLYEEGGLYVDADDKRIAPPDELLHGTSGAMLFKEPFGALANNIMYSPPRHPVFAKAIELSLAALLARESDSTWFKTGPGLMTRATALFILDDPAGAEEHLTLRPYFELRQYVQPHIRAPHKVSQNYWNAPRNRIANAFVKALGKPLPG